MQKKIPLSNQSKHSPLIKFTRSLLRKVNKAINEFDLISEGDSVCVAVSGGKDSLSLLHLLIEQKRFFPMNYSIGALHIVSDYDSKATETKTYLKELSDTSGVSIDFEDIIVTKDMDGNDCAPSCFWCSWNRREALFKYCVEHGYNKLALAHHFDDVAQTTLMNLIYHANLETMLPKRAFFDGKFDLIRPLFYLRERELARLSKMAGFTVKTCECEYAVNGKRRVIKQLVQMLSKEAKYLHNNIWQASKSWWEAFGDRPCHPEPRENEPL
ncbi:tRNA 2-thiocytidine biosynthesis TtcA family protein [Candidatus Latescibacterota bacterium]